MGLFLLSTLSFILPSRYLNNSVAVGQIAVDADVGVGKCRLRQVRHVGGLPRANFQQQRGRNTRP